MAAETLPTDQLLLDVAEYVDAYEIKSAAARDMARYCLMDSLGCALEALEHDDCTRLLGPVVPGTTVPNGARVPGTSFVLDPVTAAFNIATMVRWLDFSDTWVTAQTTHPSDDVGAILAVADYLSRLNVAARKPALTMAVVLDAMIKAHELQGSLGAHMRLSETGIDHPLLPKIACAAVVAKLLGGTREQIVAATSLAFFEPSLCAHRFGSNVGPRKGWAAAESTSHGVRLALMAVKGEPGYPNVLTQPKWGFNKWFLGGREFAYGKPAAGVMEGVLFKILCPVVIHAQSAIECALQLYPAVHARIDEIAAIKLAVHVETFNKINKTGTLRNAADRDHCLQYAVAVALLHGRLTANDYTDEFAADPRIDRLRALMQVNENPRYTAMLRDRAVGANPNSIEIVFTDGTQSVHAEVEFPVGHPRRRKEGIPLLVRKFEQNLGRRLAPVRQREILDVCMDHDRLARTPVNEFVDLFVV
ncbi:MAG: 2-methylcitrate dehydratase [Betaproteobacteria bacterium]|nr:2-methylcitrate dehydratase [Betaproteobacteria bacterium]